MEAEERPTKIRKLSDGGQQDAVLASGDESRHLRRNDDCAPSEFEHNGAVSLFDGQIPSADAFLESKPSSLKPSTADCIDKDTVPNGQKEDQISSITTRPINSSDNALANNPGACDLEKVPIEGEEEEWYGDDDADSLPTAGKVAPIAQSIDENAPPMSKNQQKKLRKKAEWESKRDERKVVRKEKLVAKRERKRAVRQQEAGGDEQIGHEAAGQKQLLKQQKSVQLPITIVIDCDFDDLMRDNERISLGSQITRCYSDNKNSMLRAHLTVCSFGGKLKERYDGLLNKHYQSWRGVRFLEDDFVEAAKQAKLWMVDEQGGKLAGALQPSSTDEDDGEAESKAKEQGEVIYLSSDSNETLTKLKPYSTYIIGGLVDKNREKGICYKRAMQKNVKTARLPIGEYVDMTSRKVLATNHVNEIMLKWLECGDWGEAFMKVIPKRKGGQLKQGKETWADDDDDAVEGAADEDEIT